MPAAAEQAMSSRLKLKQFIYAHPVLLAMLRAIRRVQIKLLQWEDRFFEFRMGIATYGEPSLDGLTIRGGNASEATTYGDMRRDNLRAAVDSLKVDYSRYTFVDYGAGKGRAILLAASWYPFQKVIGIEFAKEMHQACLENMKRWRGRRRCSSIECHWLDALEFELPNLPCVLFFNDPFGAAMLNRVLGKTQSSLNACPRDLLVIMYNNETRYELIEALFDVEVLASSARHQFTAYRMRSR